MQHLHTTKQQLKAMRVQLRQLRVYYGDNYEYRQSQELETSMQVSCQFSKAGVSEDVRQHSDVLVLQQNLRFSLEQIIREAESYRAQQE
ncbi:hypothetical protein BGZ72_003294 [Mortierella alpina]|nr:hypothetical protein BGZ72_003294 [Mortierella alpina]